MNLTSMFKKAMAIVAGPVLYTPSTDYLQSAYDAGCEAGMNGAECWENPHCLGTSLRHQSGEWHAGWCFGRQIRAAKE